MTLAATPPDTRSQVCAIKEEYLTVAEVAERLRYTPKTVRNKMHDGTWLQGVHWFRRHGSRPRLRWSAIESWLTATEERAESNGAAYGDGIPRAHRGRSPRT